MACEIYFNVSRTAVELLVGCFVIAAGAYLIKDLMDEEMETIPNGYSEEK